MANNQYNFLDYAGLSLFWNNVKSIIEENELATATALTDLDTRVDNVESSKADKGHMHSKSQITDFPTSLPASDVYSWAKQSTKPSYSFSEITPGTATIGDGSTPLIFRTNSAWKSGIYHSVPGNESMVFANINPYTSWIFATADPNANKDWSTLSPSLQIKKGKVVINKLIASTAEASYNLDVNGSANATTLYENGVRVSVDGHTHISLPAERFDSDDPTPSSKNGLTFQFSYNLGSGASGWWNVLNMRAYSDINYTSSQIITPADNPGTDTGYSGDMKWRQGRNSTWLDWKTILDSNNYTTYCTPANIGAAPSSHTHTKSQITDFPTSLPASDVKAWAKADTKPSYTGTEVTLSGYSKNNSYTPIASGDSVQAAIAKLEGAINGLEDLLASI